MKTMSPAGSVTMIGSTTESMISRQAAALGGDLGLGRAELAVGELHLGVGAAEIGDVADRHDEAVLVGVV